MTSILAEMQTAGAPRFHGETPAELPLLGSNQDSPDPESREAVDRHGQTAAFIGRKASQLDTQSRLAATIADEDPRQGTRHALPFLPVKTCPCGRWGLVGRQRMCEECKVRGARLRNRERMRRLRGVVDLNGVPSLPFSKYTQHGTFRCQFRKSDGTQCQHSRPHGANVCATHRGIA